MLQRGRGHKERRGTDLMHHCEREARGYYRSEEMSRCKRQHWLRDQYHLYLGKHN